MHSSIHEKAFTLVEILIVIAIIGTVVAVPVIAYGNISQSARDTRRKQDIEKVSAALQQYRNEFGTYPQASNYGELADYLTPKYVAQLPSDPRGATAPSGYLYRTEANGISFTLYTLLEKRNGANNEVYTSTPKGTLVITGTPPLPTMYISPTGSL